MDRTVLERLSRLHGDDRKALLDAARDVSKGSRDPQAQAIARAVLDLVQVA